MKGDGADVRVAGASRRAPDPLGPPPRPRLLASAHDESAASVFTGVQWVVFAAAVITATLLLIVDVPLVAQLTHDVLVLVFLSVAAWRLLLCVASAPRRAKSRPLKDADLPTYTLICPLYREAGMVAELGAALARIDYPPDKLQALFVLEADDEDTRLAAAAAPLPSFVRVIAAPPGHPRTKPRACNIALEHATGERVVIYDAEDRPHPQQLREAAARFAADPRVACLQAPLRISPVQTFLHRQFALEYAALFEVTLPAMARLGLPFPLGGTSNHFRADRLREAGGWDAWNVTEDADMGFRFAARGWRIGTLRRPTWETPPDTLNEWIPQRTRWLKGYIQTWTVRTRRPWRGGWRMVLGLVTTLGKAIGSAIVHGLIAAWLAFQVLLATLSGDVSDFRLIDAVVLLVGWWAWCLTARIGARRAGLRVKTSDYFAVLAYWPMQTLAAARALWQLVVCPFHWDKTPHRPLAEFLRRWTRTARAA